MKTAINRLLRSPLRSALRSVQQRRELSRLFGRQAGFVPPIELMYDGLPSYREFKENGDEFMRHYVELCGLGPAERILDVGCGTGRKTLPLISYLNDRGSYQGLDIVKAGVDWCREKYTRQYPNFRFLQIDVYNQLYNPDGHGQASDYKFPVPDEDFDLVVLNSVFTHMMPDEVENYLAETARVLKKGGRSLVSFFLLNDESLRLIDAGKSTQDLRHQCGPARASSKESPESSIGYSESFALDLHRTCGLEIGVPIHYGSWCGRTSYLSYQDLIVGWKR